jgi:hypothetical protein
MTWSQIKNSLYQFGIFGTRTLPHRPTNLQISTTGRKIYPTKPNLRVLRD